jgi:hypothetical protein
MNLTSKTTREQVADLLKAELAVSLATQFGDDHADLMKFSKAELISMAMHRVLLIQGEEKEAADAAEAARQQVLAEETACGRKIQSLMSLKESVDKRLAECYETVKTFRDEICKGSISSTLTWKAEGAMVAENLTSRYSELQQFLSDRIMGNDKTTAEIDEMLREHRDESCRRCLDDGYRHCSTNALDNVENMCEFKGQQVYAKFVTAACRDFDRVMRPGSDRDPRELARIYLC